MINIHSLQLTHNKDLRVLVPEFSLTIQAGDKLALIGEEGNGKSTLLKFLYNKNLVADYVEWSGSIQSTYSRAGYLPQILPRALETTTWYDYFFMDDEIDFTRLYQLAGQLHFDSDYLSSHQTIGNLSGGECLKVQLLKLLSSPHDILFLDEPSNDMDVETLEWLEDYIATAKETIVFISHDPEFLSRTANRILHLEMLKKKKKAQITLANVAYETYVIERQTRIEKQTQQAVNDRKEFSKKETRFKRIHDSVQHALREMHDSTQGRLLAKKMHAVKAKEGLLRREEEGLMQLPDQEAAIDLCFEKESPLARDKVLLQVDKEVVRRGEKVILPSISWTIKSGQKVAITGQNGLGKTSFLKQLLHKAKTRTRLKVAYMPQDYQEELDMEVSPLEFLSTNGNREEKERIRSRLASLQFTRDEIHHEMSALSGGQMAKVLLLHVVLSQPDLLILDEPTRNLSPLSHEQVVKLFQGFKGTLVCVSHDRRFMDQVCDQVYELTLEGLVLMANNLPKYKKKRE